MYGLVLRVRLWNGSANNREMEVLLQKRLPDEADKKRFIQLASASSTLFKGLSYIQERGRVEGQAFLTCNKVRTRPLRSTISVSMMPSSQLVT